MRLKIIIIANDDIVYSGILLYPLLKKFSQYIDSIFIQDGKLSPGDSYFNLVKKLFKISGFRYVFFLVIESLIYKIIIYLRRFLKINNYDNDNVIEFPSFLGKKFKIPVFYNKGSINKNPMIEQIKKINPDLVIAIRYAEILKKSFLDIPKLGVLNFHPSLLPQYGGIAPMIQGLINNESKLGYSFHYIDEKIDTGDILFQEEINFSIYDSATYLSLKAHIQASINLPSIVEKILNKQKIIPIIPKSEKSYFSWPTKNQINLFYKKHNHLIIFNDFLQLLFYDKQKFLK